VLLLDGKVYRLLTIPDYISKFQGSFEPKFYKDVQCKSGSATPEETAQLLTNNSDKIHRKALPLVRNKIWHSDKSFKLQVDGTYLIPEFEGKLSNLAAMYQKWLELKIKIDAAKEYH
jgi:hypothetical protein